VPSFEFDPAKAAANLKKHGVSFDEAITVFADPLRSTIHDEAHSLDEQRFVVVGQSTRGRILFVVALNQTPARASSAYASPPRLSENNMKKSAKLDPLGPRTNLDFSKGVRGKYTNLLAKGTNVAIIDPTLHPHFPDSESVNRALRAFLAINHQVQEAGTRTRTRRTAAAAKPDFDPRVGVQPRQASR
jgi:uncharacterized DUF497 family protein